MQDLLSQATEIVKKQYPQVVFVEADGLVGGRTGNSFADVKEWTFIFLAAESHPIFSVIVEFKDNTWGDVYTHSGPRLEDIIIEQPLPMDLDDAVQRMRNSGISQPFSTVTVRSPLDPSFIDEQPYYIFNVPDRGGFVFVSMKTGHVFEGHY